MTRLPGQNPTRYSVPNQNIENNPMQSSRPAAGMGDAGDWI
jgi:hypothetical protein